MPAHQVELALWLEADRMGSLLAALDEESMENQRDVVKNERRQRYDNVPYGTAFEKLTALAYPEGHPYHHTPIGSMADLDAATLEDARAFFRTYYAPNNAVLSVVGDIDPEQTLAWVEKYFGSIPSHDGKQPPRDGSLPDTMGGQLREVVEEDVPARALMAAYRLPHDGTREADAADLALTVLGGGESSPAAQPSGAPRPHRRLGRASACCGWPARPRSAGWTSRPPAASRSRDIEAAVDEELARFADEGPTDEEMERAQAQLEREWLDRLGTVARPGRRTVPLRGALRRPAARPRRAVDRVLDDHRGRRSRRSPPRRCAPTTGRSWCTSPPEAPEAGNERGERRRASDGRCRDHGVPPAAGRRRRRRRGPSRPRSATRSPTA